LKIYFFKNNFICQKSSSEGPMQHCFKSLPIALSFLIITNLNIFAQQVPDSSGKNQAVTADTAQKNPTPLKVATQDSTGWFEKHADALIGAIIGAIVTLLVLFVNRQTKKKAKALAKVTKESEIEATRAVEQKFQEQMLGEIEQRYFEYVRHEHGRIRLFGFISSANVDVRLLDVFVSLRFSESRNDILIKRLSTQEERDDQTLSPPQVLERALKKNKSLLLLGGPGSGKTTLLKYFAICCLSPKDRESIRLKKALIPIFVPLRQIDPSFAFADSLAIWAKTNNLNILSETFDKWLHNPGALVLLDGLDEVSDLKTRRKVCEWIDKATPAYPESTFVITCRFTGYRETEGVSLQKPLIHADVLDLSREQQYTFLRRWFVTALREGVEEEKSRFPERLQEIELEATAQANGVMEFLNRDENRSLREMASVPVLLQIIAIIWKEQGSLPGDRGELYSRSIDYLLDLRDRAKKIEPLMNATKARLVLRPLALWMQVNEKDEIPREEIEKQIVERLQEVRPEIKPVEFLENIRDRAGVLVGSGANTYTFQHKSFREYLAALEIANQQLVDLLVENFGNDWWQEVILFAAGIASPEIFPAFVKRFLKHEKNSGPTSPLLLQVVREATAKPLAPFKEVLLNQKQAWQKRYNTLQCVRLLYSDAAQKLVEHAREDKEPKVRQLTEQILAEWSEIRLAAPSAEKLGHFFNPIEKQAEYILIPSGSYRFSVTGEKADVLSLYFAKYPVINRLYRRFIAYLKGENNEKLLKCLQRDQFIKSLMAKADKIQGFLEYLGNDPAKWTHSLRSRFDDDKRLNGDDQPVVGVSWFAAVAYCHWLTELHKSEGGYNIRENNGEQKGSVIYTLPTETEWEWAAVGRAKDGRLYEYPWGNESPDHTRAN
jgi:energy-coupling factor transporter ATP-binding protein EcfA2